MSAVFSLLEAFLPVCTTILPNTIIACLTEAPLAPVLGAPWRGSHPKASLVSTVERRFSVQKVVLVTLQQPCVARPDDPFQNESL